MAKAVGKGLLLPMDSFDVSRGYGIARESTEVPVKEATSLRLKLIDLPLPSEFTGAAAVNIDTQVLTGKLSCTAQGNLSFLLR